MGGITNIPSIFFYLSFRLFLVLLSKFCNSKTEAKNRVVIMDSYTQITKKVKVYYNIVMQKTNAKYVRETLIGAVILVAMVTGYMLNHWYKSYKDTKAFSGLLEVSRAYEKAEEYGKKQQATRSKEDVRDPWEDVDVLLDAASSSNASSSLAPFFILYEAQLTLEQDHDQEKALSLLEKGLSKLSSGSVFYSLFNMKRIKMALDSEKPEVRKSALIDLIKISQDPTNYSFDEALYVLGVYHLHENKLQDAIDAWKRLVENQPKNSLIVSPWAKHAQEKLKALGVSVETK